MIARFFTLASFLLLAVSSLLDAQPAGEQSEDSIRTYRLGEVTVSDRRMREITTTTVQQIPFSAIARTDAPTAASIAYTIPAARVQVNSRGEALLYMRGGGERQVALFFDGALLNVPWDNRVDLSLVPLATVGGISVARGVSSVLYGANTLGGAVNMVSQERMDPGFLTEASAAAGSGSAMNGSLVHMGSTGGMNYVAAASLVDRKSVTLPGGFAAPFNQPDAGLRTNSDQRSLNLYGRVEVRPDFDDNPRTEEMTAGVAVNIIDGEKGVAPETHVADARFWRYPVWRYLAVTMHAQNPGLFRLHGLNARLAAWWTTFEQNIDQFNSADYSLRAATEEDLDRTLGARAMLRYEADETSLDLAVNVLSSTHRQRDLVFDSTGALVPYRDASGAVGEYPTLEYRQRINSVGLELRHRASELLAAVVGASFDLMSTPVTGDKPALEGFTDYSATAGVTYGLDPLMVRASVGRKTRFPTMRELYGEALRRFLINPDLQPEEGIIGEVAVEGEQDWGAFSAAAFTTVMSNTIDQRTVDTLGRKRRQRINLEGSRTYGLELTSAYRGLAPLRVGLHATYMHSRGFASASSGVDSTFYLSEKPEIVGTLTLEYPLPGNIAPVLEVVHTGRAWTLNDANVFVDLAPSTIINARLSWRLFPEWTSSSVITLFVRANNIVDAVVLPQLGLPGPGREFQAGVKVAI